MSDSNGTGTLDRELERLDDLSDNAFRGLVEARLDTVPGNKQVWKLLCHRTLIDRTEGCLEEIAEELQAAIAGGSLRSGHFKVRRLGLVNLRLQQVAGAVTAADKVAAHASYMEADANASKTLVRQLAQAIDAHRLECIARDLSPEPHDVALWDVLDALTLPARDRDRGPTLAEQIANHWHHPQAVSD